MTWKITGAPGTGDDLLYSQAGTPTLDLRFASSKSLNDNVSGRNLIDFTRGGNGVGTYVGSDGLIKNSVVNLLTYSEDFKESAWTKNRASITTDAISAPGGFSSADKLVEDTSTNSHFITETSSVSAATRTFSIYVKAAGRTRIRFEHTGNTGNAGRRLDLFIDSSVINGAGTIGTGGLDSFAESITPVGNGWFRLVSTITPTVTTGGTATVFIGLQTITDGISYTGDGTSGIYLWGAQLEQSSSVGEYVRTTSSISGAPRFDHDPATGESLGLLIEESRANLLLNSATLATQDVTVTAVAHTLSFYGTGTVTLSGTHSATVVGTGAYPTRTALTFTPTAGTLTVTVSGTVQYANLEAGSFATSWIPTTSATVTRNADVAQITGSNFSRWYSQSQGTVFTSQKTFVATEAQPGAYWFQKTGTVGRGISMIFDTRDAAQRLSCLIRDDVSQGQVLVAGLVDDARQNAAHAWSSGTLSVVLNTTLNTGSYNAIYPGIDLFNIGYTQISAGSPAYLNGTIRRLCFFDRRLPNAVLQAITAP